MRSPRGFMLTCKFRWSQLLALAGFSAGTLAGAPPVPASTPELPFRLELGVSIPMRDGTRLSSSIYRPVAAGKYPVVFVVTPYTADRWHSWGGHFARHGYIFVSVDARGRGNSAGQFEPWVNEGRDGIDIVRWAATIQGSDGRVAAWGGSYSGKNQWAFAAAGEPALKTLMPAATGYPGHDLGMLRNIPFPAMMRWLTYISGRPANFNLNRDDAYWTGAYAELAKGQIAYRDFDRMVGNPSPVWRQWAEHPDFDSFWRRGTPGPQELSAISLPLLAVTGAYDDAQLGTLRYWLEHHAAGIPKPHSYLVIGPWDHPGTREPRREHGGLTFAAESAIDMRALNVAWLDWVLKGGERPAFLADNVVYYVSGSEQWQSAPTLEAATRRRETLFLASRGANPSSVERAGILASRPPVYDEDSYIDDPGSGPFNEGPEGGTAVSEDYLIDDRLVRRLDGDGLVYETPAFRHPANIVGRPDLTLQMAVDAPDADFRAQLYEVKQDGSVVFLAQDQIRARYREDPSRASLLTPGRFEEYRFNQFPFVARTLAAGSRIRLVICPLSASIHQQRNRHSGRLVADETAKDNRVATVRVRLGRDRSRLTLPFGRDLPTAGNDAGPDESWPLMIGP